MLKEVLIAITAYLLGSLSPSYFFSWIKGVNLRRKGTKNLGATNVFVNLGKFYGVIVALFDVCKGALAVYLAYFFNLSEIFYYLAGIAVVLGHIFPFYLKFKGGKGVATSIGCIISLLFLDLFFKKWVVLVFFLFAVIMIVYRVKKHKNINLNRKIYRCLAFVFPIIYTFTSREALLWIIGIVLFLFLIFDVARIFNRKINKILFKPDEFLQENSWVIKNKHDAHIMPPVSDWWFLTLFKTIVKGKERRSISTSSYMLISFILSTYFFDKNTVILAMFLTILGDGIAEIYGRSYGKRKFLGEKTIVGSFACFVCCFFLGMILVQFYQYTYLTIFIGSLATAIIELISTRIDDNLTLPLGVSFVLRFVQL